MSGRAKMFGAALAIAVTCPVLLNPAHADAAEARGCAGRASSYDAEGRALDNVTAPGAGGTEDHPFHVDANGTMVYRVATTGVIERGTYVVTVSGFTVASGVFDNADGHDTWTGVEDVGRRLDTIPALGWAAKNLELRATVKVDFIVSGPGGTCEGSVVLRIGDDPEFTPLWLLAIVLLAFSFWALFSPSRMRWFR
jgi:hypothetical protein